MARKTRSLAVTVEKEQAPLLPPSAAREESPLFAVALLRVAMELKKPKPPAVEDIMAGVVQRMGLPQAEFNAFLEQNAGLLRAIAQKKRYESP